MTALSGYGLAVTLPSGWDGRIYRRTKGLVSGASLSDGTATSGSAGGQAGTSFRPPVVLQAANVPIPATAGDFGGGAVEQVGPGGIVAVLFEYPGSAGTALFRSQGIPRNLKPRDFDRATLQRAIAGHVGVQRFFTESGRAFCLYAVLGDQPDRTPLVAAVNDLLGTVVLQPAP
jgi:hypothetical protein